MLGSFIDTLRLGIKARKVLEDTKLIQTEYGILRVLDTESKKPVIITIPDGPNVIEHHHYLIQKLSNNFRVICFELPGLGFSYPILKHDYSFERSANIILSIMNLLGVDKASLSFSCSNGFYAIKAAQIAPDRFTHLFLSQTPSLHAMKDWTKLNIPKVLTYPVVGQLLNALTEKKLAKIWYKTALPKSTNREGFEKIAINSLNNGGCFCLSSLVQGLSKELYANLVLTEVPCTQIWGKKDYSHRNTDNATILEHLPNCEIIEFENCGHFPELENTDNFVKLVNERVNVSIRPMK